MERRFRGQTYFYWQTFLVFPAPSPALRGCGEPFESPATDIAQSRAPFGDQGATHCLSFPPAGQEKLAAAKAEFAALELDGIIRRSPLGLSPPHGEEAGWLVAVLRGLSPAQQRHRSGHLPTAEHDGFFF